MGRKVEVARTPLDEPVCLDVEASVVTTVSGGSGCGKTSLCNVALAGLFEAYRGLLQAVILDPKGGLGFIPFKKRAHVLGSPQEWPAALSSIQSEMDRRFRRLAELERVEMEPSEGSPLILVVADEVARVVDNPALDREECTAVRRSIEDIACRGRQAKVCMLLMGQVISSTALSTATLANVGTTVCMRTGSGVAASMAARDSGGPSPRSLPPRPGFMLFSGPTTDGRVVKARSPAVDGAALRGRMDLLAAADFRQLACLDYDAPGHLG